jgi:hypothetical protein
MRLRVFVGSDPAGNPLQVTRTCKGTKKQADTALAEFVAQTVNGGAPLLRSTNLEEFLDRWLDHITPTRSPTTVRGYRFKVQRITSQTRPPPARQVDGPPPRPHLP